MFLNTVTMNTVLTKIICGDITEIIPVKKLLKESVIQMTLLLLILWTDRKFLSKSVV